MKRLIYSLPVLLMCFLLLAFTLKDDPIKRDTTDNGGFKIRTVVVDAGHGGRASGASGYYSLEKNVTLAIALKLQKLIEKELPDVKVVMTRTTDESVELYKRSEIANKAKGNLFISIHCNSLPDIRKTEIVDYKRKHGVKTPVYKTVNVQDHSGHGVLLLVYNLRRVGAQNEALRENEDIYSEKDYKQNYDGYDPNDPESVILLNTFKNKYRKQSIRLAELINDEFVNTDGRFSNGVIEQVVLVLDHTAMPAVLVETGFINNRTEEDYLNSESGQLEVASSILRALKTYKKQVEAQ